MGPHLLLIFLKRSLFYHYNAFWPQVIQARFHFRTHWIQHVILGVFHELQNCHKMRHLVQPAVIERRASFDHFVPDPAALKDVSGNLVSLGKPQS